MEETRIDAGMPRRLATLANSSCVLTARLPSEFENFLDVVDRIDRPRIAPHGVQKQRSTSDLIEVRTFDAGRSELRRFAQGLDQFGNEIRRRPIRSGHGDRKSTRLNSSHSS